jgi:hypothetical protein
MGGSDHPGAASCLATSQTVLLDHGLPLVHLKEQRRNLIIALMGRKGPINKETILEIAAIQQTIAAMEAAIVDLDAELQRIG